MSPAHQVNSRAASMAMCPEWLLTDVEQISNECEGLVKPWGAYAWHLSRCFRKPKEAQLGARCRDRSIQAGLATSIALRPRPRFVSMNLERILTDSPSAGLGVPNLEWASKGLRAAPHRSSGNVNSKVLAFGKFGGRSLRS